MPDLFDTSDEVKPAPLAAPVRLSEVIRVGEDIGFPEDLMIDPNTGEILEVVSRPTFDGANPETIAAYLGPRLVGAESRRDAFKAEKAAWIKKIDSIYDPQIKREEGYIAFLKFTIEQRLKEFAAASLVGKKTKTMRVGLLALSFKTNPARVKVSDEAAALVWAKKHCKGAVKIVESVLISQIPADALTKAAAQAGSGFAESPEFEKFEVK